MSGVHKDLFTARLLKNINLFLKLQVKIRTLVRRRRKKNLVLFRMKGNKSAERRVPVNMVRPKIVGNWI